MKIAIIGLGGAGSHHLNIYKSIPDVQITAIVEPNLQNAIEKTAHLNIPVFRHIDELLHANTIEMVDICTPTTTHPELAVRALNKGLHVLCEKPISLTLRDAKRILKAAKRTNSYLMIGHVIRFWPEYVFLKKIYDQRTYGKLEHLLLSRIAPIPQWSWQDWMVNPETSGGGPIDIHIHDTDYVLYLLGMPLAVTSFGRAEGRNISYISTMYEYENTIVQAEGGWYGNTLPFFMSYRASFEGATLEYKDEQLTVYEKGGKNPQQISTAEPLNAAGAIPTELNLQTVGAFQHEIQYFINCIKTKTPPQISTPESSLQSLWLVYKELESARKGKKIRIKPDNSKQ